MPKIGSGVYPDVTAPADTDRYVVVQGGVTKEVTGAVLRSSYFAAYCKNNFAGTAPPGATDDDAAGYAQGSRWIDATASPMEIYECVDPSTGTAVWLKTSFTIDELGTGALRDIEAADAENDFLVAGGSPCSWLKKTLAEVLTILGKAAANGLASLDGSSKVVQDPANATATATAGKIPVADGSGKLDTWVSDATESVKGKVELASNAETIAGTETSLAVTPAGLTAKLDTDGALTGNSDTRIASQKAVKTYVASQVTAVGVATVGAADCENIIEDLSYYPPVTFTWDPGSLADGAGETSAAISVPGVSLGGAAVQCIAPYDLQGITLNAYVDAADSCKARLQNETTGTIDLASGTWTMQARRI